MGVFLSSWMAAVAGPESIERLDPGLDAIIAPGTQIETLCTGFRWAEGPVWDAAQARLLFSDVPNNIVYQWREGDKEASIYLQPSGFTGPIGSARVSGANGLAWDQAGRLLSCEHGDRRVSVLTESGGKLTVADRFQGKRFNSPNDLALHSGGDLYFTDPPYGLPEGEDDPSRELPFFGVFRVTPAGEVHLLVDSLIRPNGLAFSPDESVLYVAQSHRPAPVIMAYPVKADGNLGEGEVFFDSSPLSGPGLPDGLKVGPDGTVFATGPGGLLILNPQGQLLGRVLCTRPTANVAFGNGGRFLYLTSQDRVLRLPLAPSAP